MFIPAISCQHCWKRVYCFNVWCLIFNQPSIKIKIEDLPMWTVDLFVILTCSARMSSREGCTDDRGWGAGALYQIQRDFPQSAHPARTGSSTQNLWWEQSLSTSFLSCVTTLLFLVKGVMRKNNTVLYGTLKNVSNKLLILCMFLHNCAARIIVYMLELKT